MIYTWITKGEPKGIVCAHTKGELKKKVHFTCDLIRVKFRWQTLWVASQEGKLLQKEGEGYPYMTKALIVDGGVFHAIGSSDPYAPFNEVGAATHDDEKEGTRKGEFTEVGRAWVGAVSSL